MTQCEAGPRLAGRGLLQAPQTEVSESGDLPPEDSDAWLAEGGKDLEQQLAQRQAELDAAKSKSSAGRRGGSGGTAPGDDFDAHVMAKRMQVGWSDETRQPFTSWRRARNKPAYHHAVKSLHQMQAESLDHRCVIRST